MTPEALKLRLDAGVPPVLVDVRHPFEREIADIPECGQLRIPIDELAERMAEVDLARTENPPGDVVFYCRTGGRAGRATELFRERGNEDVYNLEGGVMGWRDSVDPSIPLY